jgi:hypothetical protein
MALRRAASLYPRLFATKNRTQFLAYAAAYEPISIADLGVLVEARRNAVWARFIGLEKQGILLRFKGGFAARKQGTYLVALNRGHPAFRQVRDLLDALNRRIPLPPVVIAERHDPIPRVPVRSDDVEAILGSQVQRRSLVLLGILGAADAMLLKECWRSGFCPTWHSMDSLVRDRILWRDPRTSVARLTINPRLVGFREFVALLRALAKFNREYDGMAEHARDIRPYLKKEELKPRP